MRGNPFIRLVVAIAVFLLLGIPVWKLTRGETTSTMTIVSSKPEGDHLMLLGISFQYEAVPKEIRLKQTVGDHSEGMSVQPTPGKPPSASWTISRTEGSTDIVVSAEWPDKGSHALRMTFTGPDMQPMEKTLWLSAEHPSDVITLQFSH